MVPTGCETDPEASVSTQREKDQQEIPPVLGDFPFFDFPRLSRPPSSTHGYYILTNGCISKPPKKQFQRFEVSPDKCGEYLLGSITDSYFFCWKAVKKLAKSIEKQ